MIWQSAFTTEKVNSIINKANDILSKIGIFCVDLDVVETYKKMGYVIDGNYIRIPVSVSEKFLHTLQETKQKEKVASITEPTYDIWINNNSHSWLDFESKKVHAFTLESLEKATCFVQNAGELFGVYGGVPGYAMDIPAKMQAISRYWIGCKYLQKKENPEPICSFSAKYLFEMAEVMGNPIKQLPVYMVSPLKMGGESFEIAVAYKDQLEKITVISMPAMGANTPLSLEGAFTIALAETLGGAILVQDITGVPTDFSVQVLPFDLRALNQTYGSPEKLLLEWAGAEFNSLLFGTKVNYATVEIHTQAITPGAQSCAEKSSIITAALMKQGIGAFCFRGAGTIAMDEVFSPEQLLLDYEMLNHAIKIQQGFPTADEEGCTIEEILEGIETGYMNKDRSLDHYMDYTFFPKFFERRSYASCKDENKNIAEERVALQANELYRKAGKLQLDLEKADALNRIFAKALLEAKQ